MGRISIMGADVFICLFGVFAILRALAPQFEFLPQRDLMLEVFWPSTESSCIAEITLVDRGVRRELSSASGRVPYDSGRKGCRIERPLAEATAEYGFEVELRIPILSAANCSGLLVKAGSNLEKPADCSDTGADFEVAFLPGEA
ncbi:hypothetical protein [uncultured Litoreibacter sp.]|uniref:hypothetical protein n=1 Tax=uncultured Litoreibacter sp. TaxID=1392394 RepID=UPI0026267D6F|nr:hypothetical protein [uncultured Litoreibacter sp.]